MSEEQFNYLHSYTWTMAMCAKTYTDYLLHAIMFFIQGLLVFGCLRAREETAACILGEFNILDEQTIEFQMKRDYKSHKLDANYKVVHKCLPPVPHFKVGERYVTIFKLLQTGRKQKTNSFP